MTKTYDLIDCSNCNPGDKNQYKIVIKNYKKL